MIRIELTTMPARRWVVTVEPELQNIRERKDRL